ncbi:MAG: hypothetical protein EHM72_09490 [Calditrichaeota bacterium]|nr:MAG: hypothetical protein EHM72_09490 [Calditrichota bacterium]
MTKMKNPTYAKFINEVANHISTLSKDDLIEIILTFAESQNSNDRNAFLLLLKNKSKINSKSDGQTSSINMSSEQLIEAIQEFEKRIQNGEFYDEEKSCQAFEREERSYWQDYDDDDIDFSEEEYVTEAIDFLETAKLFFRSQDIETATAAYEMMFDIFENSEYYDDEYFTYGFTFEDTLDADFLKEHKTINLRCQYLRVADTLDFQYVYNRLINEQDLFLSDIIEISRDPLPSLDQFIDGLIEFIGNNPKYDYHLVDVLFIRGGIDEIRKFAYNNGNRHPSVFLYYYESIKEKSGQPDVLKTIFDGIEIIPEEYQIRSYLGLDLIKIAKETNDRNYLTIGYNTAFYSNPTLKNLTYFINHIISKNYISEIEKMRNYLKNKDITNRDSFAYSIENTQNDRNIFSTATAKIDIKALIVGKFLLDGIENLIENINPKYYLGFSGEHKYIAIITALTLQAISKGFALVVVEKLLDHYCLDTQSDEYILLKEMITNRSQEINMSQKNLENTLKRIESLSVNRVAHILGNKLRGGYDSACLLLVACAEVEQYINHSGNTLIQRIDGEFKKFSAFRRPLKTLTASSKILHAVK